MEKLDLVVPEYGMTVETEDGGLTITEQTFKALKAILQLEKQISEAKKKIKEALEKNMPVYDCKKITVSDEEGTISIIKKEDSKVESFDKEEFLNQFGQDVYNDFCKTSVRKGGVTITWSNRK